jgi:hypothetical protein
MPVGRKANRLTALKEQSDAIECETAYRPYMKAIDNETKTAYFIRPNCKLWSCPSCAQRRRRVWMHIAVFGGHSLYAETGNLSFVTLTSHRLVQSVTAGIAVWRKAWPKLSARMRRATDGAQFLYVPEVGKLGRFHVHMITNATLPESWYKDNSAETGLGYIVDAEPVFHVLRCGAYVGKYLSKSLAVGGWPPYWRRINTSRRWPKPEEIDTPYDWSSLGNHPQNARLEANAYRRMGWTVATSLEELGTSQVIVT